LTTTDAVGTGHPAGGLEASNLGREREEVQGLRALAVAVAAEGLGDAGEVVVV
jgi:hypothetical protein